MSRSNYDKEPHIDIRGFSDKAWHGYKAIMKEINEVIVKSGRKKTIVTIDCYHGVYNDELLPAFSEGLSPYLLIDSSYANLSNEKINTMLERNITDDRVFGVLSCHRIDEFFDPVKLDDLKKKVEDAKKGIILIYGVGAHLIAEPDISMYADMARWEIQLRMRRNEIGNWCADNKDEEMAVKYKRSFFIDWRVIDRHKANLIKKIDYLLDTNIRNEPKMITGNAFRSALLQASKQPFRVVPYFDMGPWGGQWMKHVCGLDEDMPNYAWCFDCVPEENSLYLKIGNIRVEIPSIDLVLYQPVNLLGDRVHARFGTDFPIRFDLLDTMEGGNLSLQVHPLTEYIQQTFGMHYTQDESYYILDAKDDAKTYLGLKKGINADEMVSNLKKAQDGQTDFDPEKYINIWQAKKHDHFLIPGGTVHCSGRNCVVLEISATTYIFTFKLWDWDRLGLDGKPRPIHIDHGSHVIQWYMDTDWTRENLINRIKTIKKIEGITEEKTGLHEREFIETRRHWFTKPVRHKMNDSVNVLNLIEGDEALVESVDDSFDPFVVHYAETFIIPAAVGGYIIRPYGKSEGKRIGTIKAYIR